MLFLYPACPSLQLGGQLGHANELAARTLVSKRASTPRMLEFVRRWTYSSYGPVPVVSGTCGGGGRESGAPSTFKDILVQRGLAGRLELRGAIRSSIGLESPTLVHDRRNVLKLTIAPRTRGRE